MNITMEEKKQEAIDKLNKTESKLLKELKSRRFEES